MTKPASDPAPTSAQRYDRGAVTAELVVALPLLLAVTVGLVWFLALGSAQVRTVDAAREVARAVARGDDQAAAVGRGADIAPDGARVRVTRTAGEVVVVVEAQVQGPGGLFALLPVASTRAEAVAAVEGP